MPDSLIANPFIQFHRLTDDDSKILLTAPKPGEGLQTLTVFHSDNANIFDVFSDLSETRFDFLDADIDLNKAERDLLQKSGILVAAVTKIEKPLFSCNLEDVETLAGSADTTNLIVNPTFRYEPFDLSKFVILAQERHLSPYRPTVWIENPVTKIEFGYWLGASDAEIVSKFTAGESLREGINETLLRGLIKADILVSDDSLSLKKQEWNKSIVDASSHFNDSGYAVVRGLFPPGQMRSMREYYRQHVDQGFMPFGDSQVERRYREHNEPFAAFLHGQFSHLMGMVVGEEVKLSYVYAASYKDGSILTPHTDREQCEYSVSFQVDYQPEPVNQVSPWAIFVEPLRYTGELSPHGVSVEWDDLESAKSGKQPTPIHLASGDGLIYKGRELVHYRHALPQGHQSTSLFFHFVAKDFGGNLR